VKPYDWPTTSQEIDDIRATCTERTHLCLAGGKKDAASLITFACGKCLEVTSLTEKNKPVFRGKAWWYFTPGMSMGYAPKEELSQVMADPSGDEGDLRLSWHLNGEGGWRAGDEKHLSKSTEVFKYIFVKEEY